MTAEQAIDGLEVVNVYIPQTLGVHATALKDEDTGSYYVAVTIPGKPQPIRLRSVHEVNQFTGTWGCAEEVYTRQADMIAQAQSL